MINASAKTKNNIIISIPNVWGIRNIVRSHIYSELKQKHHIYLAVPQDAVVALGAEGIDSQHIIVLKDPIFTPLYIFVSNALKQAHKRKYFSEKPSALLKWHKENKSRPPSRAVRYGTWLGGHSTNPVLFRFWELAERSVWNIQDYSEINSLIESIRPVFALSTSFVSAMEWKLFAALQKRRIRTATHILSFDNLTSRGHLPWRYFDHYFVWSESMAAELSNLYRVPPTKITVTGTPQFDYHVQQNYVSTPEKVFSSVDLDSAQPYFVYGANHGSITPNEPQLVDAIIRQCAQHQQLRQYQWVIRLHPLDNYERWRGLEEHHSSAKVNLPWQQSTTRTWAVPQAEEIAFLGNLLRYASATLCVASTLALDSAIVDTPIICVGFNSVAPKRESQFYYDVHFTDHYKQIIESNGVTLVENLQHLESGLLEAVNNPGRLHDARKNLIAKLAGYVDGKAAQRLLTSIQQQIPSSVRSNSQI